MSLKICFQSVNPHQPAFTQKVKTVFPKLRNGFLKLDTIGQKWLTVLLEGVPTDA